MLRRALLGAALAFVCGGLATAQERSGGRVEAQIGAFPTAEQANRSLSRVLAPASASQSSLSGRVEPASRNGTTLYRALVTGFQAEAQARAFCARQTASCIVRTAADPAALRTSPQARSVAAERVVHLWAPSAAIRAGLHLVNFSKSRADPWTFELSCIREESAKVSVLNVRLGNGPVSALRSFTGGVQTGVLPVQIASDGFMSSDSLGLLYPDNEYAAMHGFFSGLREGDEIDWGEGRLVYRDPARRVTSVLEQCSR